MKYSMFKCISIKMENISNKTNNNIRKKWLNVILVAQFMSHFIKSHSKIITWSASYNFFINSIMKCIRILNFLIDFVFCVLPLIEILTQFLHIPSHSFIIIKLKVDILQAILLLKNSLWELTYASIVLNPYLLALKMSFK